MSFLASLPKAENTRVYDVNDPNDTLALQSIYALYDFPEFLVEKVEAVMKALHTEYTKKSIIDGSEHHDFFISMIDGSLSDEQMEQLKKQCPHFIYTYYHENPVDLTAVFFESIPELATEETGEDEDDD